MIPPRCDCRPDYDHRQRECHLSAGVAEDLLYRRRAMERQIGIERFMLRCEHSGEQRAKELRFGNYCRSKTKMCGSAPATEWGVIVNVLRSDDSSSRRNWVSSP